MVRQIADTVSVMSGGHLVESGPTEDLFTRPKTAYTRALLDAIPRPLAILPSTDAPVAGVPADSALASGAAADDTYPTGTFAAAES